MQDDIGREVRQKYTSRRFVFAAFFSITGTAAFFLALMTAAQWLTLVATVLSLFGVADYTDRKLHQDSVAPQPPPQRVSEQSSYQ